MLNFMIKLKTRYLFLFFLIFVTSCAETVVPDDKDDNDDGNIVVQKQKIVD